MSTHIRCFCREIRKILCGYRSVAMPSSVCLDLSVPIPELNTVYIFSGRQGLCPAQNKTVWERNMASFRDWKGFFLYCWVSN